ncbi:hypothetical protein V6N13_027015 [Hibiscus sabdariffa]
MVLLALLMFAVGWTEGCLEEESVALFRLKPFFPFIDYKTIDLGLDLDYSVDANGNGSGEEKEGSPDCCEWERVECNPITGRVTHLFLNLTYTAALDEDVVTESNLNIFISWRNERDLNALRNLEELTLSDNEVTECAPSEAEATEMGCVFILSACARHEYQDVLGLINTSCVEDNEDFHFLT